MLAVGDNMCCGSLDLFRRVDYSPVFHWSDKATDKREFPHKPAPSYRPPISIKTHAHSESIEHHTYHAHFSTKTMDFHGLG